MKFIYGRQDFHTLERGQENCYLLTNGLGGFSSATIVNSAARNDHAFLMACVKAPNHRYNMIHRMSERIFVKNGEDWQPSFWISSQEITEDHQVAEDGCRWLSQFSYEDCPVWIYQHQGIELRKVVGMSRGMNRVAVRYHIINRSRRDYRLAVMPLFQFVRKGEDLARGQEFSLIHQGGEGCVTSNNMKLYFRTNGNIENIGEYYEQEYYAYDARDGRRDRGMAYADHRICLDIPQGMSCELEIVYQMEPGEMPDAKAVIREMCSHRKSLAWTAGLQNPIAKQLAKSADQFISRRESTGGETILAGYPFFEDWGRDTMIALPGCCLATGQYDTAKKILRTFIANERRGLMPNLFPEGGNEPAYNTVDAALLFINCVYLYCEETGDMDFLQEAYPVMKRIVDWYQKGTDFGIHMEEDGLLAAGEHLDQVTWMDVRVGEILPTPRHGKPVEINAYWYNALRIMERYTADAETGKKYAKLAEQVKVSFTEQFWMEEQCCLRDVISGTSADEQIRCNQIWAVSMPFTMLDDDRERMITDTVFEKLYTPCGLRTLAADDEEFQPFYGGTQFDRDMAYHQGTVWVFPLGAYYLAYLKVNRFSEEAKNTVRSQLEVMESLLREGCVGQLPEIYDGMEPSASRGCFAQAWSVGEILRVYKILE